MATTDLLLVTVKRLTQEAEIIGNDIVGASAPIFPVLEALALTKAGLYLCSSNNISAPDHLLQVFDSMNEKRNSIIFEE